MNLLIETSDLATLLANKNAGQNNPAPHLVLVDVRSEELYREGHLPDARRLEYASIIRQEAPVGGLLPETVHFNSVLQALGINANSQIVAYDGEGGAAASRLIWTLHAYGFNNIHLLNGGITAWVADGLELSTAAPVVTPGDIALTLSGDAIVSASALMSQLESDAPTLLDARTIEEYTGSNVRATHGGRIPGAMHLEWTDAIDKSNGSRLLPDEKLHAMLEARGAKPEKPIVVYCQTHHRSALSYTMLLHLGYQHVTALEGAWSNWGNRDDTPKEVG